MYGRSRKPTICGENFNISPLAISVNSINLALKQKHMKDLPFNDNLPPGYKEEKDPDCKHCNGTGIVLEACCPNAYVTDQHLCSRCLEHAIEADCPYCDGTGFKIQEADRD